MSNIIIRDASLSDILSIKNLYLDVAEKYPDNLTPLAIEVTDDFVYENIKLGLSKGFAIVIEKDGEVIGYAQGYQSSHIREFHTIKDTRMIIHSKYNSAGYAIKMMDAVQNKVKTMRYIKSALFHVRGHNTASAKCLQFFGCYELYRSKEAILRCDGSFMDDILYQWDNPNFSIVNLKQILQQANASDNHHQVYVDSFNDLRRWSTNMSSSARYAS